MRSSLPAAIETHLYRIAQEAVNNAVRHAESSRITIVISLEGGMVQLEIRDNGHWKKPATNFSGIGLRTMEYRAMATGGHIEVVHPESGGTRVLCQIEAEDSVAIPR